MRVDDGPPVPDELDHHQFDQIIFQDQIEELFGEVIQNFAPDYRRMLINNYFDSR